MQNLFNSLPDWIKFSIFTLITVALLLGVVNFSDLTQQNGSDESIQVEFVVQTEQKQPIEGAKIQFIFDGAPEPRLTDSNGYVRVEIPQRYDIDVVITKEGFKTLSQTMNLKADTNRTRVYQLETDKSSSSLPITYQHYTAQNEFIPFTLSLLTPNFDNPIINKVFTESLGSKNTPFVYSDNPVFKAVNNFKLESGNQKLIKEYIEDDTDFKYITRDLSNVTASGYISSNEELASTKQVVIESEENFVENHFLTDVHFVYAPIDIVIQTNNNDSKYTSFIDSGSSIYEIVQLPKLLELGQSLQQDYNQKRHYSRNTEWIRKIIKKNPNIRGFLVFRYPYWLTLNSESFKNILPPICGEHLFEKLSPSPYIKFTDIKNNQDHAIRIESLTYESINEDPYKLTIADQRNSLFKNKTKVTEEVKNINLSIEPNQHLLIPLEFGFDTEPIKNTIRFKYPLSNKKKSDLHNKLLYVSKPLSGSEYSKIEPPNNLYHAISQIPTQKISFDENFINNTISPEELLNLIPKKFAVGSILNLNLVKVDGQIIEIDPPSDEPTIYVSPYLQAGSCPYLVVYNYQKNYWIELGTILSGREIKLLQGDEIHSLGDKVSSIKIEEREQEVSYIDALSILYIEPTTEENKEVIYPMPELKKVDGDYFILHQGESFEINLEELIPANASDIKLNINGYYQLVKNNFST